MDSNNGLRVLLEMKVENPESSLVRCEVRLLPAHAHVMD